MTETASSGSTSNDAEVVTGSPRWVKVLGAIVVAIVLFFLVLKLSGKGGEHGPGRHGLQDFTPVHLTSGGAGHLL